MKLQHYRILITSKIRFNLKQIDRKKQHYLPKYDFTAEMWYYSFTTPSWPLVS